MRSAVVHDPDAVNIVVALLLGLLPQEPQGVVALALGKPELAAVELDTDRIPILNKISTSGCAFLEQQDGHLRIGLQPRGELDDAAVLGGIEPAPCIAHLPVDGRRVITFAPPAKDLGIQPTLDVGALERIAWLEELEPLGPGGLDLLALVIEWFSRSTHSVERPVLPVDGRRFSFG